MTIHHRVPIVISVLAVVASTTAIGISQHTAKTAIKSSSPSCSVGPKGSPGASGAPGSTGSPGASGKPGTAGSPGSNGAVGPTGAPGSTGAPGTNGTNGTNGSNGTNGTNGTNGSNGSDGAVGPTGAPGPTGATGPTGAPGTCSSVPYTELATDLIPSQDNVFSLGTAVKRWKSLQLGPGTLYLQDVITGIQAGITVVAGSLLIDGADSLRIGNIRLTANGLESLIPSQDIQIGTPGDTGYLSTARGIKFPDGTTQRTATLRGERGLTGATGPQGEVGPAGGFGSWGSFFDPETQLNRRPGEVNYVSLNKSVSENGVRVTGDQMSRITFAKPGTYNISFSLQMDNDGSVTDIANAGVVEIWLKQNGRDVPNSNTKLLLPTRTKGAYVAAWNFFVTADREDDYVELVWASNEREVKILGLNDQQTTFGPAIPSAIVTVNQVGQ